MKNYIRRAHSLLNKRQDSCRNDQREDMKEQQKWIDSKLSEADQYYIKLIQDCLNFETIEDVKNYQIDVEIEESLRTESERFNIRADALLKKVSSKHKLIGDLKKRFNNNSNLVFNFKKDKDGEIACTYFNFDELDIEDGGGCYLYLSHREVIYPRSNINFAIKDGGLDIVSITSHKEGKNHGSFMLALLLDLIPVFNKKIEEYNLQSFNELQHLTWDQFREGLLYKHKANHIYGTIGTPGLSEAKMQRLINFYKRNDLHKDGAIYREI